MKEIELRVSIEEANLILEGIGQMPFARVYGLVEKIQRQAGTQLADPAPAPSNDDAAENARRDARHLSEPARK